MCLSVWYVHMCVTYAYMCVCVGYVHMYVSVWELCANVYGYLMKPEEGASPELELKVAVSHPVLVQALNSDLLCALNHRDTSLAPHVF